METMMDSWERAADEAMDRDPRQAPFGYFSGSYSPIGGAMCFQWFDSVEALLRQLRDVEPCMYGLAPGQELQKYQAALEPLLQRVAQEGLTQELLAELQGFLPADEEVRWWGRFDELLDGRTDFARRLVQRFYSDEDGEDDSEGVDVEHVNEFVECLRTCGL